MPDVLFASVDLVAEIERAERSLLVEAVAAIADRHPERDTLVEHVGGGVATYSGPGSPLNKVAGLGFAGPVDDADLARVEGLLHGRGCPVQVELSTLAHDTIAPLLTARGYRLVAFENVLGCAPSRAVESRRPTDPSSSAVEVVGDDDFPTWLDTAVSGFAAPDADGTPAHESFPRDVLEQVISDMAGARGFVRYLAVRDGAPAGAASMRIDGAVAQLTGAATLPKHRRRGVQATLLARRLADAAHAGCEVAVVTTQPGSISQRNAQRRGFELLYTRAILVLEPQ